MPDNHLQYHLCGDEGVTGNFEVTAFKTADLAGEGVLIYSKQATQKFPMEEPADMEGCCTKLTAECAPAPAAADMEWVHRIFESRTYSNLREFENMKPTFEIKQKKSAEL